MNVILISDTHENIEAIDRALEKINARSVDLVLHCGDIISPPVFRRFTGLPLRAVFGNNDGEREGLQAAAVEMQIPPLEEVLELELAGKSAVMYHGTKPQRLDALIDSQQYDYVFCGHTHELRDERKGRTRILNPGAFLFCAQFCLLQLSPENDFVEQIPL